MALNTRDVEAGAHARPCRHLRQHHPGAPNRMLPCAWPGCEVGVTEERLAIGRSDDGAPLLLERRALRLEGSDESYFWHPCRDQR